MLRHDHFYSHILLLFKFPAELYEGLMDGCIGFFGLLDFVAGGGGRGAFLLFGACNFLLGA